MKHAFILGGTSGLGLEIAKESRRLDIEPIIAGRSANSDNKNLLSSALTCQLDLTDLMYLPMESLRDRVAKFKPEYFFWVAGNFIKPRKPLLRTTSEEIESLVRTHLLGPMEVLKSFHRVIGRPYHLITISSTSSWRMRENESVYCMAQAGKAHFTRNFTAELVKDYPGSQVTLIDPGGMKTEFFDGTGTDIENFMDPAEVAGIIWGHIQSQVGNFEEIQIERGDHGQPLVSYGPRLPELP